MRMQLTLYLSRETDDLNKIMHGLLFSVKFGGVISPLIRRREKSDAVGKLEATDSPNYDR